MTPTTILWLAFSCIPNTDRCDWRMASNQPPDLTLMGCAVMAQFIAARSQRPLVRWKCETGDHGQRGA